MKAKLTFFILLFNSALLISQENENYKVVTRPSSELIPEKFNKQLTESSKIIEPTSQTEYMLRIEELKQDSLKNRELIRRMEIKLEQIK